MADSNRVPFASNKDDLCVFGGDYLHLADPPSSFAVFILKMLMSRRCAQYTLASEQ
jgi:hypothetical protein